ncbi:hypothetical protein ACO0SA_000307 [Hanseniaspora valbyensis]
MSSEKNIEESFKEKTFVQKRLLLSCNNCKKHKIKCDKEMPQCKSCFKKGVPCLSACPSTQREVPRSYLLYLEDLLYVYSKKLRELGVDCDELKSNFPTTSMDPCVNVDIYRERFTEENKLFNNENRYIKRASQLDFSLGELNNDSKTNLKRSFSSMNDDNKNVSIIKDMKKNKNNQDESQFKLEAVELTPSNSNISKSNILESFHSTTSMAKSSSLSHSNLAEVTKKSVITSQVNLLPSNITPVISNIRSRVNANEKPNGNEIKTYLGDSSGVPFAKLMLTAINFQNESENTDFDEDETVKGNLLANTKDDIIKPVEIPIVEDNVNSLYLPSFEEAEKLISAYFNKMNPQYPILEFSMFYNLYFKPLYGTDKILKKYQKMKKPAADTQNNSKKFKDLEKENSLSPIDSDQKINNENETLPTTEQSEDIDDSSLPYCCKIRPDKSYSDFIELLKNKYANTDLYDLLINQKYKERIVPLKNILKTLSNVDPNSGLFESNIELPNIYKKALFFTNLVMSLGSCSEVLLNGTLHCITLKKRAMKWMKIVLNEPSSEVFEEYESHNLLDKSSELHQIIMQFRKLESLSGLLLLSSFSMCIPSIPTVWYSIGIPLRLVIDLGLHNEKYNNELLSLVLTSETPQLVNELKNNIDFVVDFRSRLFWTTYSMDRQLALYFGRPVSLPDESISLHMVSSNPPRPIKHDSFSIHTRIIAIAMMEIRKLQSELLTVMYAPRSQLPREFETLDDWRKNFDKRLNKWYSDKVPKKLTKIGNIQFKREFFRINFYHTKTMLNGISPRCDTPNTDEKLDKLYNSTKNMIYQYHRLWLSKSLNYTWIACHNLFMCTMTFLYTRYKKNDYESLDETCNDVLNIIKAFIGTCEAAPNCYKTIKVLSRAVKRLIVRTKKNITNKIQESPVNVTMRREESADTDPELQLFFDKLLDDNDKFVSHQPLVNPDDAGKNVGTHSKQNTSEDSESIWGLDDEYKTTSSFIHPLYSSSDNNNFSEEQRIYDMLYSHANKMNVGEWASYMLSSQDNENNASVGNLELNHISKKPENSEEN